MNLKKKLHNGLGYRVINDKLGEESIKTVCIN